MATIAFLGLGQMGSPMANNLLQKGHSLQVFCNQVNHLIPTRVLVKGGEITCKMLK